MTMPYYVAPEQVMKDRAEYAQKGIARGRSLIATTYDAGIAIVADNPSRSLHKISEIYDRIAFAGVGKYNEFDQLRVSGIRHADTKGYAYSREDVDARSLANLYAQYLGQVFTHEMKPLEVEILVAELGVGTTPTAAVPHRLRGDDHRRGPLRGARGRDRGHRRTARRGLDGGVGAVGRPARRRGRPGRCRIAPWSGGISRRPCWPRATGVAPSVDWSTPNSRPCWPERCLPGQARGSIHGRAAPAHGTVKVMDKRIYGLENEYGVTCTLRGQRRLSPDEVARYLFRRVVELGTVVQRLPGERCPSLPRCREPSRVRHPRMRRHRRAGGARQGGGVDPLVVGGRAPRPGCVRRASGETSTCSRTTPTRPATPTDAMRTT